MKQTPSAADRVSRPLVGRRQGATDLVIGKPGESGYNTAPRRLLNLKVFYDGMSYSGLSV